ncbi:MAG TPA: helix-turn-helix domain-containing protein [Solirubrobacteraceae bacterium]|jgi:AcrR family transcriptional regulator|nr:helix-turn-helix domain-containing protein [Solirubrobacteraceae bacterium]
MSARAQAAAETAERVLATAWKHFASRPYERVRLREIADEAGVSAQTLHNRFHSKEELFTAAFMHWGLNEISEREAAPVDDAREAIRVLFDRYETQGDAVLRQLSQEETIPAVRQMTDAGRAYHRHWARHTFAPLAAGLSGAARERRLTAIVTATDLLVWKLLRRDARLARAQAERVMLEMIDPPAAGARRTAR